MWRQGSLDLVRIGSLRDAPASLSLAEPGLHAGARVEWAISFLAHHVHHSARAPVPALGKKQDKKRRPGLWTMDCVVGMEAFQGSVLGQPLRQSSIVNRHSISDDPSLTRSVVAQGYESQAFLNEESMA